MQISVQGFMGILGNHCQGCNASGVWGWRFAPPQKYQRKRQKAGKTCVQERYPKAWANQLIETATGKRAKPALVLVYKHSFYLTIMCRKPVKSRGVTLSELRNKNIVSNIRQISGRPHFQGPLLLSQRMSCTSPACVTWRPGTYLHFCSLKTPFLSSPNPFLLHPHPLSTLKHLFAGGSIY